ncbi:hypothetical protein [Niallia taxi]|uniref:hypothetical protein n=1 Tax=Niallia taxi TaxID=2499688 RepID=UPI0015F6CB40|nr:hypothetical protein [Niallia taxi]
MYGLNTSLIRCEFRLAISKKNQVKEIDNGISSKDTTPPSKESTVVNGKLEVSFTGISNRKGINKLIEKKIINTNT